MSVDADVDVDVVVDPLGGGGGTAPGECIVPANTEIASAMLRIATADVRHKVFTMGLLQKERYKIFCISAIMQGYLYGTLDH